MIQCEADDGIASYVVFLQDKRRESWGVNRSSECTQNITLRIFMNPVILSFVWSARSWTSATRMATSSSSPWKRSSSASKDSSESPSSSVRPSSEPSS